MVNVFINPSEGEGVAKVLDSLGEEVWSEEAWPLWLSHSVKEEEAWPLCLSLSVKEEEVWPPCLSVLYCRCDVPPFLPLTLTVIIFFPLTELPPD